LYTITLSEDIAAPAQVVWEVITNLDDYPRWNTFVVACESTLAVGAPIVMQVRLGSTSPRKQTEIVRQHLPGELLEYGMRTPLRLLWSKRQHRLTSVAANAARYQSLFELRGPLSPLVAVLMGTHLQRGFAEMTRGIARRAESIHSQRIQEQQV
jgi:uncharacterized protein YndB with AHSA1/START domain